jgi:lysozyme
MIGSTIDKLASLILGEEGLRLSAYQDQAGVWTIGYGHKIVPADNLPLSTSTTITPERAKALRDKDMLAALSIVSSAVQVPLKEGEKLALSSLAYNIGASAFANSTLVKLLNAGDREGAVAQFAVWNKITKNGVKVVDPILVARRRRETALFRSA